MPPVLVGKSTVDLIQLIPALACAIAGQARRLPCFGLGSVHGPNACAAAKGAFREPERRTPVRHGVVCPPCENRAEREFGAPLCGSWSQCIRERERGFSMNWPGHRIEACLGKAALKTHALQTLRDCRASPKRAKRLECVRFIGAFRRGAGRSAVHGLNARS